MSDFTNANLEAALLDQKVAGVFHGKVYAFVAVINNGRYQLGVAIKNERGYNPIQGKTFERWLEAREWAEGLNEHIGLTKDAALNIVGSTMFRRKAS